MGGNQALKDAGILAVMLPQMVRESYGSVNDGQVHGYLTKYEKEMISRGFKWVKASEEGHDLFDFDTCGGKFKFWMIITIMRIVKYVALFLAFLSTPFVGKRKPLLERVEAKAS